MTLSEENLQTLEKLSALLMPIRDIAIVLQCRESQLRQEIETKQGPIYLAYQKGKIATKLELRRQELMLAKVGSPLAVQNMNEAIIEMEDDE